MQGSQAANHTDDLLTQRFSTVLRNIVVCKLEMGTNFIPL